MFAQFQARYPTGSLISELMTIYHGKYVVRVLVLLEGVTRATGMAVADTIEAAEDRARIRALEVMGIRLSAAADSQPAGVEFPKLKVFESERLESGNMDGISTDTSWLRETTEPSLLEKTSFVPSPGMSAISTGASAAVTGNVDWTRDDYVRNTEIASSVNEAQPTISFSSKVTPIGSRRHDQEMSAVESDSLSTDTSTSIVDKTNLGGLVDHSELIARIGVSIKRLGWNNKQGSDYLQRTYGKKTRHDLADEELLEFLEYLESLPNPTL